MTCCRVESPQRYYLRGSLEQRPLEPGWFAQVTPFDPAIAQAEPNQASPRNPSTIAMPSRGSRNSPACVPSGPSGSRFNIWSIRDRVCSTSRIRIQTRALTSALLEYRYIEAKAVIRRPGKGPARVKGSSGGAARHSLRRRIAWPARVFERAWHRPYDPATTRYCRIIRSAQETGERRHGLSPEWLLSPSSLRSAVTPPGTMISRIRR